jgi:hypothetical protein
MKTGCACLRARLLHGATGNRLFTLKLRLSFVSVPVVLKATDMPIRRLVVNIEIHSWYFLGISGRVKLWLRLCYSKSIRVH